MFEQGGKEHLPAWMEAGDRTFTTTPGPAGPSDAMTPAAGAGASAPIWVHAPTTMILSQSHTQSQSLFFRALPLEIRLIIYHYAFQGTIHIICIYPKTRNTDGSCKDTFRARKLAHVRCDRLEEEKEEEKEEGREGAGEKENGCREEQPHLDSQQPCWTRQRAKVHGIRYYNSTGGDPDPIPPDNLLALMLTCRRISTESHPYLYSTPHFDFNSETTLLTFLRTYSHIPNHDTDTPIPPTPFLPPTSWYLSRIRSVSFHLTHPRTPRLRSELFTSRFPTWEEIWDLIATYMIPRRMHWKHPPRGSLRHIRLRIDIGGIGRYRDRSLFRNARQECEFFEPVGGLKKKSGSGFVREGECDDGGLSFVMEASWPVAPEVLEILPKRSKVGKLGQWFETDS